MIQLSLPTRVTPASWTVPRLRGAEFANGVAVADFQPGVFAGVFFVLGHFAQGAELEDAVVAADAGVAPMTT